MTIFNSSSLPEIDIIHGNVPNILHNSPGPVAGGRKMVFLSGGLRKMGFPNG